MRLLKEVGVEPLLLQFFALSVYVFFMGFTFCDGFKLHIVRKLIWFLSFLLIALSTFKNKDTFDLSMILPLPTLLAFVLCWQEKILREKNQKNN